MAQSKKNIRSDTLKKTFLENVRKRFSVLPYCLKIDKPTGEIKEAR